jgi:hypothetical protein
LKGKTPEATVAARIYVEAKKRDGQIVKVERGVVQARRRATTGRDRWVMIQP